MPGDTDECSQASRHHEPMLDLRVLKTIASDGSLLLVQQDSEKQSNESICHVG